MYCTGFNIKCLAPQQSSLCLDVPTFQSGTMLHFIWPKSSSHSDGYCAYPPRSSHFSDFASSCNSVYLFTSSRRRVCLQSGISTLIESNDEMKVYFVTTFTGPRNSFFIYSYQGYSINGKGMK